MALIFAAKGRVNLEGTSRAKGLADTVPREIAAATKDKRDVEGNIAEIAKEDWNGDDPKHVRGYIYHWVHQSDSRYVRRI